VVNLDLKDKKLLATLEFGARKTETSIGKSIGLRPENVRYRVKRLEEQQIIHSYFTYVNIHKLGYVDFGLYIQLSHLTSDTEQHFVQHCKDNPNVSYFAKTGGNYNYIIGMFASDILMLHALIQDMNKKFSDIIESVDILSRLSVTHFPRQYLAAIQKGTVFFGGALERNKPDTLDHNILCIMSTNARIKVLTLAKQLNRPHSTITLRIKELEKKGIITGHHTVINVQKLGLQQYNLLIKVRNVIETQRRTLSALCQQHPHIVWLIQTIGLWDFEVGVEVENQEQLQEIMTALRETNNNITRIDFVSIFKTIKYTQYPFKML